MALKLLRLPSPCPPDGALPPLRVDPDFLYRIPLAAAQVFTALRGTQTLSETEDVLDSWPLANQALLVASPTLERERRRGTLRPKAERQMQRSLHRYLIRASTRSLPFGLFAAIGSATCAPVASQPVSPTLDVAISALSGAVQQARPAVEAALPPDLRCYLNPTAQWKNGTLSWETLTAPAERCCPCSPALHSVLQACREPVELAELLEQLNPSLIRALLSTDVLLSEFQPLLTVSPEHSARLNRFSQHILGSDVTQAALRKAYSQAGAAQQLELLRSALTPATVPDGTVQRTLALDAVLSGCVAVPPDVSATVLEGVLALRASPVPQHPDTALNDFQNAWGDRFGEEFGPFGSALALWQQAEERAAYRERQPHAAAVDERWTALLDETTGPSLCLTDDLLTSLSNAVLSWPDEFDVLGWLLAADLHALRQGEYSVALLGGSTPAAGQTSARSRASHPVLPGPAQHARPGHILTALCLQHPAAAANDTARCWPGTSLELHVPGHPSVPRSRRVDVSRLQIRCRAGQTEVWCGERGQCLHLHLPTLTRADQLGPTARFLVQIALQRRQPPRWQWGECSGRPVLPRVTRGRCVLSAARWRFPDAWRTAGDLSDQQLQRWLDSVQLPDLIQIGQNDRQLTLDLGHPVHRDLLRAEWRSGATSLREALATPDQAWLEGDGGQRHLFEGVWTVRRGA